MTDQEYIRKTFTLTHLEIKMLERIIKKRHPRGTRRESETIRDLIAEEFDRIAWDEDERDMQRIANEWAAYDRDPPGS